MKLFRRFVLFAGVLVPGLVDLAPVASAASATVVYPTGQFPIDVQNVQAAIDKQGTVLLKARNVAGEPTEFNFGPPLPGSGWVQVIGNVALAGEQVGSVITTIRGGFSPIRIGPAATGRVAGIDFEAPLRAGIVILAGAAAADIVGNRIAHVVGRQPPGAPVTFSFGIETFGAAFGRIAIQGNVIDDLNGQLGIGIAEAFAQDVDISGNHVRGTNSEGIEAAENFGTVRVSQNTVEPGPERFSILSVGAGIEVVGAGAYQIVDNTIVCENANGGVGVAATGGGLYSPSVAPIIQRNHIVIRAPFPGSVLGGIQFYGHVNHAFVGQNWIEGNGFGALGLFDAAIADNDLGTNTFVGNNIAGFTSDVADVFLDAATHDTVLAGRSGSVIDLGINNRITGFSAGGNPQIGWQISQAIALRNQSIHEALRSARAAARTP